MLPNKMAKKEKEKEKWHNNILSFINKKLNEKLEETI